jgi:hypothetical protein
MFFFLCEDIYHILLVKVELVVRLVDERIDKCLQLFVEALIEISKFELDPTIAEHIILRMGHTSHFLDVSCKSSIRDLLSRLRILEK